MFAGPLPVKSCMILACRDTLAAGIATQLSGSFPSDPEPRRQPGDYAISVDDTALPRGMQIRSSESLPSFVTPLHVGDIAALHRIAVGRAWLSGAWDLGVTLHPPMEGMSLGLVTAFRDFDGASALLEAPLVDAAQRGRLATWLWLPMRNGPKWRVLAHAAKDATLGPDNGRDGAPPPYLVEPVWDWRGGRKWLIRLGQWSEAHRPPIRVRPATPKQRAYISALQLAMGAPVEVPSRLSLLEGSAMIDRLKAEAAFRAAS